MSLRLRSREEYDELKRWLRDTRGYWPQTRDTTLTEDGVTSPLHIIVLDGRWNTPRLEAWFIDRVGGAHQ